MRLARRDLLLSTAALAGCSASPEPALFTLAAVPPARPPGPPGPPGGVVQLRRIALAGYLDRPEVMRGDGAVQFRASVNERWAEPLDEMLGRVLAEDLTQRLPGTAVFTAAANLSGEVPTTIEIEVQRFEADAAGLVALAAQIAVRRRIPGRDRAIGTTMFRDTEAAAAAGTAQVAAAMSRVLGRMADAVAALLRGVGGEG